MVVLRVMLKLVNRVIFVALFDPLNFPSNVSTDGLSFCLVYYLIKCYKMVISQFIISSPFISLDYFVGIIVSYQLFVYTEILSIQGRQDRCLNLPCINFQNNYLQWLTLHYFSMPMKTQGILSWAILGPLNMTPLSLYNDLSSSLIKFLASRRNVSQCYTFTFPVPKHGFSYFFPRIPVPSKLEMNLVMII